MTAGNGIYCAAVVGGGIIGLAVAVSLAAAGRRVVVIERRPPRRVRGALGFDPRTVALSPASAELLGRLGGIEPDARAPIERMRVWEHDGNARLDFAPPGNQAGPLAQVVENSAVACALWQAAGANVERVAPASVTGLDVTDDAAVLHVETGERDAAPLQREVRARLVVGADGANSRVRALAGVALRRLPAPASGPQRALATVARASRPHGNVACQRFGATGPVALLPLPERRTVAVIWSTSEAENERLQGLNDAAFRAALTAETEGVVGEMMSVDERLSFAAEQTLAAHLNPLPRVLLAGDAARTLHPLAGQGVNVGLEDVAAIAAEARRGGDLGAPGRWRGYAAKRRARSKLMIGLMRALLAAYCGPRADGPWLRLARNTALRLIDGSAAAKAQLAREAMGLGPLAQAW